MEVMFEDIRDFADNSAYLKAVEEKDVSLVMLEELPEYKACLPLEAKLKAEGKLSFNVIFHEPSGFYFLKNFLISEYSGEKAIFIKDVENYRSMRSLSLSVRLSACLYVCM